MKENDKIFFAVLYIVASLFSFVILSAACISLMNKKNSAMNAAGVFFLIALITAFSIVVGKLINKLNKKD